ncbi:uncharacterized protein LOC126796968 [Argentina anserina]|uniref:uncharacterized protein LOC126796968 n=1 Tax=Argentina anserina TaxID=57926 RepID=UPI0021763ED3|nr:uncharacterized protein LOC126796968 [Potentilla anserina]
MSSNRTDQYSAVYDKAFCLTCFLFYSSNKQSLFTSVGFNNWRKVGGDKCSFKRHVGKTCSPHYKSMQDWLGFKHVCSHIDKVMNPQPPELIQPNRLRLKPTIDVIRLLAKQALDFRGDDESIDSSNHGNVIETVDSYGRISEEVAKVTLENAPRNATYTSPKVQKKILKVRLIVSTEHNLQVENLRGQGNNGASNMRDESKWIASFVFAEASICILCTMFCKLPTTSFKYCSKNVAVVFLFFQMLTSIISVVHSSAKRVSELKSTKEI